MTTSVASSWRMSAQRDRRVDAEQELHEREADAEGERRGGADGERHERPLGVARLAQAPGAVADAEQHERGDAERLQRDDVGEQADAEAEDAARQRAAQQADGHDEQRREVGVGAGDRQLRDRRRLHDDAEHAERGEAQRAAAASATRHASGPRGRVRICTKSRLRTSAYGRRWISCVSVPSWSIRVTWPIGRPTG